MIFSQKLGGLSETLQAVSTSMPSSLVGALRSGLRRPAVGVGSGGSLATAHYWQRCRETLRASYTNVQTPLAFSLDESDVTKGQVWIFSARGENPDAIAAFQSAITRGAGEIHIVVNSKANGLSKLALQHRGVIIHVVPVADTKDGFLATHSMVASVFALLRAADLVACPMRSSEREVKFLRLIDDVLANNGEPGPEIAKLDENDTLILLHDPRLRAAATVIDTSLWETAICAVQTTDFRNFAHGRHVWLAHRQSTAVVMALTGKETEGVWGDISRVLPRELPKVSYRYGNAGRFQCAIAIFGALKIVEWFGRLRQIDPAKPGTASFSKEIYESSSLREMGARLKPQIKQKIEAGLPQDVEDRTYIDVERQWEAYQCRLSQALFKGVVLDYDGTVVETAERWFPPRDEVVEQMRRLLEGGLHIGVATGRGKSVGRDLRSVLPEQFHERVTIGYYNGGYIRPLTVDIEIDLPQPRSEIKSVYEYLLKTEMLCDDLDVGRYQQLTIPKCSIGDGSRFWAIFSEYNSRNGNLLRIVETGHSMDICPQEVCKTHVVQRVLAMVGGGDAAVLCIGDSGHEGGNDYRLLQGPFGISVSQVSSNLDACWSFFGPVVTGVGALQRILSALEFEREGFAHLNVKYLVHDKRT
jgi:hydroxymethylpyrimidine pyrophosphatase-like HAD family hydrolase